MKLKSDAEILRYLHQVSLQTGVKLSPTICGFFIALMRLCISEGEFIKEENKYCLHYSCREFSEHIDFSFRMCCVSLKALEECGLIERVEVQKEFKRLGNGQFETNKPYYTYVDISDFLAS